MKICTVTCANVDNHGARLQTMALYRYLTELGHDVSVVDYAPVYMRNALPLIYNPGFNIKQWAKLFVRLPQRYRNIKIHNMMEDFSRRHIKTTGEYINVDELREYPPEADVYIAGSDQIWNMGLPTGRDLTFYLDFGPRRIKRLSYAASIAMPYLTDEYRRLLQKRLGNFDAMSVREESAVEILRELGCEAQVVCDPVMLLGTDVWDTIATPPEAATEPYLLTYDFDGTPEFAAIAKRLAALRGLRIHSVGNKPHRYANVNHDMASVEEFLGLVRGADCVLSNSFHATAFALMYGRDCYVVKRTENLNTRMTDLLARYNLTDRVVNANTPDSVLTARIDYSGVHERMQADIERSKRWLNDRLG